MPGGDDITVHVEWLARRLTQQQEDAAATEHHRIMVNTHRVSRVPGHVRMANPDAYTPGLVSIGPLHAKDAERRLRAGNRLKMAYLNSLLSRGHPDASDHLAVIQGYVRLVAAREREARAMYAAEDVDDVTAEDLIQMLVLDGCFIIEHLVNVFTGREEPSLHAIPFGPAQLSVDLILAENQIPFFVLVDLFGGTRLPEFGSTGYDPPALLVKLVLYYLGGEKGRDMSDALPPPDAVCHVLHLLHEMVTAARTRWLRPPIPRKQRRLCTVLGMVQGFAPQVLWLLPLLVVVSLLHPTLPEECTWRARYGPVDLPSTSDMKSLWVLFKKARDRGTGQVASGIVSVLGPVPLAVRLEPQDGVLALRLPQLRIQFVTAPLLLNLIRFEQSSDQLVGDVSAYVWFMAKMVQSPEDVAVLVAEEVVQTSMAGRGGNEDVDARFFTEVGQASDSAGKLEQSYLGEIMEGLRNRTWYSFLTKRADVQRYYVNAPWRVVAAFVTVVTTVATILQTFASFKQKP